MADEEKMEDCDDPQAETQPDDDREIIEAGMEAFRNFYTGTPTEAFIRQLHRALKHADARQEARRDERQVERRNKMTPKPDNTLPDGPDGEVDNTLPTSPGTVDNTLPGAPGRPSTQPVPPTKPTAPAKPK